MFHRSAPGALLPTKSEVAQALAASVVWARERDLPDPVAHRDFVALPQLFHERLAERARQGRFPLAAERYPLPKDGGGARTMAWMDPFDDIALRVLVGRCSASMRRVCNDDVLFSYRLVADGPGWTTLAPKQATALRRERGLDLLHSPATAALGVFDVRNYYPSVDIERLGSQLAGIGAPAGAVGVLVAALGVLGEESGLPGLPIGFEGSGPLGNVYLLPADSVLRGGRVGLVRYTDDSWLFLRRTRDWEAARAEYETLLAGLTLVLHESKSDVHDRVWGDPEGVISHSLLDYVTGGGSKRVSADEAQELLDEGERQRDWRVVRFALGALRGHQDARGVLFLESHTHAFDQVAKSAADYLIGVSQDPVMRRRIDPAWLTDLATRPGESATLAGQLHACRALSKLRPNTGLGSRLYELAVTPGSNQARIPLQTWAAFAWSTSEHWKSGRAVEGARDKGSLSLRRSFVLGCALRRDLGKKSARQVRGLTKFEPDLGPTVEYALAT